MFLPQQCTIVAVVAADLIVVVIVAVVTGFVAKDECAGVVHFVVVLAVKILNVACCRQYLPRKTQ